jgi:hypothetical protein
MTLARLTVQAGWHERRFCPVKAEVKLGAVAASGNLVLWDTTDGVAVPVQAWTTEDGAVKLAWVVDFMAPDESRVYELQAEECPSQLVHGVQLEETAPGKLKVSIGGKHFTTYNHGPEVVRPYLYPVLTADGVGVTRNWPMVEGVADETTDHPHHKGIYTAQDEINGIRNWGEGPGTGRIVHKRFTRSYSGPVAGGFTDELDWIDPEGNTYMTETRRITFYSTPLRARLFDYSVTLHASEGDLVIGDTKEGGLLSARVASSMDANREDGGLIVNGCGGMQEGETWGKRAPWCDYSGPVGDDWYGISLMDHGTNPRYPTYWHVRGYGLMTANCFGLHDFSGDPNNRWEMPIPGGESRTWKYRVLIHHGDAVTSQVAMHYENFAYPPQVTVRVF